MFTNLKLIGAGILTAIVFVFGFLFNRRGKKIDEQEKVINAKEQEIKTSEKVNESKISKEKLKNEIKKKEVDVEKKTSKAKNETQKKIYETADNEEYEIKV